MFLHLENIVTFTGFQKKNFSLSLVLRIFLIFKNQTNNIKILFCTQKKLISFTKSKQISHRN